jgi:lysophospholipase L1-like esterase
MIAIELCSLIGREFWSAAVGFEHDEVLGTQSQEKVGISMRNRLSCSLLMFWCLLAVFAYPIAGAEPLSILSPAPNEVIQRQYWVPQYDYVNRAGGALRGIGKVPVRLMAPEIKFETASVQVVNKDDGVVVDWQDCAYQIEDGVLRSEMTVPAGGWYRCRIRLNSSGQTVAEGTSERFGVGEVFIVAGQSYATNCNDKIFQTEDSQERVVCWDWKTNQWRVAHDPQPVVDGTDGGSIWPLVGDQLAAWFDTPIAFVNVAYGGTSSEQWKPGGNLHNKLKETTTRLGHFRGVLWQQGESDVIDKRPTAKYVENLISIREAAFEGLSYQPRWWIAKSTLHPTVYVTPQYEQEIRNGYTVLINQHGFDAGPDTDRLGGENRGGPESRRHFSEIGQINAAKLWCATLYSHLTQDAPSHWGAIPMLASLRLRDTCWSERVVNRESSVILRRSGSENDEVRLGFPAAEILSAASADGKVRFDVTKDLVLSDDGTTVVVKDCRGVEVIREEDLYKPAGAPQSYRHRVGNPDENLLYAPGRWFHDRNVEVTYRKKDEVEALASNSIVSGSLPRTMERLKRREEIRLGISGDSISTGLDASGTTQAKPNQFGYAELVAGELEFDFGAPIALDNRSVPGWSIANGNSDLDNLLKQQPNLIVIAYGMNDVGRRDPKWFKGQLDELIRRIHEYSADCEIIVVSPMLGNAEWIHTPPEMFELYRGEMKSSAGEGVAFADVTQVWAILSRHKHFMDLTGNGLNHPNDFGHRLYAQAILSCLPLVHTPK